MSKESLEQFVKEEFLHSRSTQDKLKATNSLDNFVDLMVSLGKEKNYSFTTEEVKAFLQDEIDKIKKKKQDEADITKVEIEAENISPEKKIEFKEEVQKKADEDKKQIDERWANNVVANWDRQTVESGIAYLRNDPVLPLYP
jgi:hypothetical protein